MTDLYMLCGDNSDDEQQEMMMFTCLLLSEPEVKPKYSRLDLQRLTNNDCLLMFRFEKNHILRLLAAMQIPEDIICGHRTKTTGLEVLLIVLRRLAYPNRFVDLQPVFGRSKGELSVIFKWGIDYIYNNFNWLLMDMDQHILNPESISLYVEAVQKKGCPRNFEVWGFIDGTARAMCRPSRNQRVAYSGHYRKHCLKYQSVMCPNGIIVNLYGPLEGRRHDAAMLRESDLVSKIRIHITNGANNNFVLYGDPAYPVTREIIAPFKGAAVTQQQKNFNKKMSSVRQAVEWGFGKTVGLFAFLDFKKNLKLYLQPVGKYYRVGIILANCHTCLYTSQTSQYFEMVPPTLENYLHNQL